MTTHDNLYAHSLDPLESLLKGVKRPGDFSAHGALPLPLPMVKVNGVGTLSFPLSSPQLQELVAAAVRAPYGRGEETVLDTSVRRVWQIDAAQVQISGKSWLPSLDQILAEVGRGLGCEGAAIRAELYKLLVYDPGGFFLAHRDSEKVPGMFGTLLLQLPSEHTGGELRICHGNREAVIDLSAIDGSELAYAAFYADCEHEVWPVKSGHRVCLVFNLLRATKSNKPPAKAPDYGTEIERAAQLIGAAFSAEHAPRKLVWLLEHQYSQAELGFAALKGVDAAVVGVLRQAADEAACHAQLGVVHIEESGPAEVNYAPRRGRRYYDDFGDSGFDASGDTYEIIEVSDSMRYIDDWAVADGQRPLPGRLPLGDDELLPAGALDDEPPDEDRLLEASGNEGVSFERAYRRAALVLWPQAGHVELLLQAGVGAALPVLEELLATGDAGAVSPAQDVAARIVAHWAGLSPRSYADESEGPLRTRMLRCLARLGATPAGERFLQEVLLASYDGSENAALAEALPALLAVQAQEELLAALLESAFLRLPRALCELLLLLNETSRANGKVVRQFAAALVDALPGLGARPARQELGWEKQYDNIAADARSCQNLLRALELLASTELYAATVDALILHPTVFDPGQTLVPALQALYAEAERGGVEFEAQRLRLWLHCCAFLLARSEFAPPAPRDWSQPAALNCRCEDCLALQAFALNPQLHEHRFRVNEQRRRHVESQIKHHKLDMNQVTERKGSPYTLVCSKTRGAYRRQCRQHAEDIAAMRALQALQVAAPDECRIRMAAALVRKPEAVRG